MLHLKPNIEKNADETFMCYVIPKKNLQYSESYPVLQRTQIQLPGLFNPTFLYLMKGFYLTCLMQHSWKLTLNSVKGEQL